VEVSVRALSRSFSVFEELTGGELSIVGLNPRVCSVWVQGVSNFSQDYPQPLRELWNHFGIPPYKDFPQ
jgi:hypothetical protein